MKQIFLNTILACTFIGLNTSYAKTNAAILTEYQAAKKLDKNTSDSLLNKIIPTIKYTVDGITIPNHVGNKPILPDYYFGNEKHSDVIVFDKILYAITNNHRIIIIGNLFGSKRSAVLDIPYSKNDTSFFAKEDNAIIDLNIYKNDSLNVYFLKTRYYVFGYQQVHLSGYVFNKRNFNFFTSITTPLDDEILAAPEDNPRLIDSSKLDSDFHSQYFFSKNDWKLEIIKTYRNKTKVIQNYIFDYNAMMFKKED